jgi:hypothetical protein
MSRYRPAPGVGVVDDGDAVYAAHLPDGPVTVLAGSAGAVWRAACSGPAETLAPRVAADFGVAPDAVAADVEAAVAAVLAAGLLERVE